MLMENITLKCLFGCCIINNLSYRLQVQELPIFTRRNVMLFFQDRAKVAGLVLSILSLLFSSLYIRQRYWGGRILTVVGWFTDCF